MPHLFRLSPSDLTFLWDECKRCFYLKVVHGFGRPQAPFPKIFSRIDRLMNHFYMGKSSAYIRPDLPPGRIEYGKRLVTSRPTRVEEGSTAAVIRGRFDTVIAYVGEVSWIDFCARCWRSWPSPSRRQRIRLANIVPIAGAQGWERGDDMGMAASSYTAAGPGAATPEQPRRSWFCRWQIIQRWGGFFDCLGKILGRFP